MSARAVPRAREALWRRFAAPVLVIVCGFGAYLNSFSGVFVFDDLPWIIENSGIRDLWPPWQAMGSTLRPMLFYSLAVNYALSELNVWSYHAVNLVVHILAALTLYGLVRRSLLLDSLRDRYGQSAGWLALATALIWVVHPLQTQSVTYVIQRGESMMGLFFLLTLYCVVRGSRSVRARWWYIAAFVAHSCGLCTKEIMVTCLPVLILFDVVLVGGSVRQALRERWLLYLAMAAPGLIFIGQAIVRDPTIYLSLRFDAEAVPPLAYALTQPGVILHYLKLAFWPQPLCFDYGWPVAQGWRAMVLPAIPLALLLLSALWALSRRRAWGFLVAAFFLVLAPTSSFMPIRDLAVEHRMYLPLAAVLLMAVLGGHGLLRRLVARHRTRMVLAVAAIAPVVVTCVFLTHQRNKDYGSAYLLWSDVVAKRPQNARGHNTLGANWAARRNFEEAEACYLRALELRPDYAEAHNNVGVAMFHQGRLEPALAHYQRALSIKPDYAHAHLNLGMLLVRQGRIDEARASYLEALRHEPDFASAYNNLGTTWLSQGNLDEAAACYLQALRIEEDYAEAHYNLGNVLLKDGKHKEAIVRYRAALHIEPNLAPAHINLGTALLLVGNRDDAIVHFRRALQLKPRDTTAQANLDQALGQAE